MMERLWRLSVLALFTALALAAPAQAQGLQVTGDDDSDSYVAIKAGTIIPVVGEVIHDGVIVIKNGKIEALGANVDFPREAKVIHAEDQVIMPGLVNPCTALGGKKYRRSGVHTDLKAADEFLYDPKIHGRLLQSGFTTLGLMPSGSGLPGQAYLFKPCEEGGPDRTLDETGYTLIYLTRPSTEKKGLRGALTTAKGEIEKVEKARKEWEEKQKQKKAEGEKKKAGQGEAKKEEPKDKKEEEKKKTASAPEKEPVKKPAPEGDKKEGEKKDDVFKAPPINPLYVPLVDLIQKKKEARALVVLTRASDLVHFGDATLGFEFDHAYRLLHTGGRSGQLPSSDLFLVAEKMGEAKARVIMNAMINVRPLTINPMNLPALFAEHGCEVTLLPGRDRVEAHAAFLDQLAQLIRGGLDPDTALKAVTLHPARALGLEARIGSIETGKDANLLFLTGDPFSAMTRIDRIMLDGTIVAQGLDIQ